MLIHGDCLDVLPTLPDASVDMVFADLPYGITANKWDACIDLPKLWAQILRIGKQHCAYVFTATQPFATTLIVSRSKLFRYDLIWQRHKLVGHLSANKRPMRCHEHVLVFFRQQGTYNPQKTNGHPPRVTWRKAVSVSANYGTTQRNAGLRGNQSVTYSGSLRHPGSVLPHFHGKDTATHKNNRLLHPTQKPVALLEWLIRTYTNEGDTVLDPTCGSGTTAIAAINTSRKWVCIEKDADYHAVAAKRIAEHQAAPRQGTLAV